VPPPQLRAIRDTSVTPFDKLKAVEHLALSSDSSLKLMSIATSSMNLDGSSRAWSFVYGRATPPAATYFFTATPDAVTLDSIASREHPGGALITQDWVNSSVAAELAEDNGGKSFREINPECSIQAYLRQSEVPKPTLAWFITYRSLVHPATYRTFNIGARVPDQKK
jgi:hypothetical protein